MARVAQGGAVSLSCNVAHSNGLAVDAPDLTLTIVDSLSVVVPGFGFPVGIPPIIHDGLGAYHYEWSVPIGLAVGDYTANWLATVDSTPATGSEIIEVVAPGDVDTDAYCTLSDVKQRLSGDIPNMGTEYDSTITAKCMEVRRIIDRNVAKARGIRNRWSFIADGAATVRRFTPRSWTDLLLIDDCVEVTSVTVDGIALVVNVGYVTEPLQGTPIVGLRLAQGGWWSRTPGGNAVGARWGFATATPEDVREVAIIEVIRSYRGDQAGNNDVIGVTPFGTPITTKAFSSKMRELVQDYSYGGAALRG